MYINSQKLDSQDRAIGSDSDGRSIASEAKINPSRLISYSFHPLFKPFGRYVTADSFSDHVIAKCRIFKKVGRSMKNFLENAVRMIFFRQH